MPDGRTTLGAAPNRQFCGGSLSISRQMETIGAPGRRRPMRRPPGAGLPRQNIFLAFLAYIVTIRLASIRIALRPR